MPNAVTSRQAKAAFKNRGKRELSEADKARIEREIKLQRRVWVAKEREKNKLELAKKNAERDQRLKMEEGVRKLGSQRRVDKFGYKSSQFHLGAFFGKQAQAQAGGDTDCTSDQDVTNHDELFDDNDNDDTDRDYDSLDGDVDDETLLAAFECSEPEVNEKQQLQSFPARAQATTTMKIDAIPSDWAELLDSGTQLARELSADIRRSSPTEVKWKSVTTGSFDSSASFDLTADDLEALESAATRKVAQCASQKNREDSRNMPPPPPLFKRPIPPKVSDGTANSRPSEKQPPHRPISLFELGISGTQLESIVDENIILTQIESV